MNRLYTLLLRGSPNTERYARYVVDTPLSTLTSRPDILQRLIPSTTDLAFANFCADQLVQLCRKSRYSNDLTRLDPDNTYASEFTQLATVNTVWGGVPAGITPYLLEPDIFHNWAYRLLSIAVDPVGMTITVNGQQQDLTWSGGTSNAVPTGLGLSLMFTGSLPGTAFDCTLQLIRLPRRELLTLDAELTSCSVPWHDPYTDGKGASDPETRIAAFILNYLEHDGG